MPDQRLQRTRDSYERELEITRTSSCSHGRPIETCEACFDDAQHDYQQGFTCTAFEGPPVAGGLADLIIAPDVMAAMTTAAAGMFNPPPDVAEKMARLRREVYDELAASTRGAYERVLSADALTPDLDADVALVMRDLTRRADARPVLMCSCADWLTCEHPWPTIFTPHTEQTAPLHPPGCAICDKKRTRQYATEKARRDSLPTMTSPCAHGYPLYQCRECFDKEQAALAGQMSTHEHVWTPAEEQGRVQCVCGLDATVKEAWGMYGGTFAEGDSIQ